MAQLSNQEKEIAKTSLQKLNHDQKYIEQVIKESF
jgi:hypothetical protein